MPAYHMPHKQDPKSDYLAVDVVLLPPPKIMDRAIAGNRKLSPKNNNEITLNKKNCLPHITLAMGCIKKGEGLIVKNRLNDISKRFPRMELETVSSKRKKAWFKIKNIDKLQLLHETVMIDLFRFFSYRVKEHMLCKSDKERINSITLNYIKHFPVTSSFGKYAPHITIGSGETDLTFPKIRFRVSELALCHLGNFCTCRKIIYSFNLSMPCPI